MTPEEHYIRDFSGHLVWYVMDRRQHGLSKIIGSIAADAALFMDEASACTRRDMANSRLGHDWYEVRCAMFPYQSLVGETI